MSDLLVGHGPVPGHSPYVPDFIIVRDEQGRNHVRSRKARLAVAHEKMARDHLVGHCTPEPFRPDRWPLVHLRDPESGPPFRTDRVEWFPLSEEAAWRSRTAQDLLRESTAMKGSPELALRSIKAAAALVSVDIEKTVRELRAEAAPGESLVETLERRRR